VGKPEVRVDAELLMEKGYISKFKLLQIYIHIPFSMIEGLYGSARALETALAELEPRAEAIAGAVSELPKPCLVISKRIADARNIARALGAPLITGRTREEERSELFEALRRGRLDVLVATTVADEGIDVPRLRCVLLSLGGASHIKTVQRAGRALRGGKGLAVVADVVDVIEGAESRTLKHAEERLKALRRAFGDVQVEKKHIYLGNYFFRTSNSQ